MKKPEQYKYVDYPGGHGTYVVGGDYLGTVLYVKVFVYDLEKCVEVEVYEQILQYTGKKEFHRNL